MRILFFSHYFPPEVNAPANRTYEHCREWVKAGHEVHVITGVPSHPLGEPFAGYRRRWYQREAVDGIHVHRVWTYLASNRAVLRRVTNYLSFVPTSILRASRLGHFDVVIGTSPQFFCAVVAWLYARSRHRPWVFEVRDLWPESISAVGAIRKSVVLRLFERLELRLYRGASAVVCVTRSFVANLTERGVNPQKLHFVPNGIVRDVWQSGDREAGRRRLGLRDDEVLVSYIGTVGMAHGLGILLDAAERLRESAAAIRFLVVGDGAELGELRRAAVARGLTSVQFAGLVPRAEAVEIFAATDVSLVTLKPSEAFKKVLPSKLFEAMAAGKPVALGVDGEAREALEEAGAGLAFTPGDAGELAGTLERLASHPDLRAAMGEAGTAFVEHRFSRLAWASRYLQILEAVGSVVPSKDTALSRARTEERVQS